MRKRTSAPTQDTHLPNTLRPLGTVVAIVLENLSADRRGDIRAICQGVKDVATASEWLRWGEQNLVQGVRAALRARDESGMPRAVNVHGQYKDSGQLEFAEFVEWAYEMARRGREMYDRAREIAAMCAERTGRTFNPDEVIQAASTGEELTHLLERLTA